MSICISPILGIVYLLLAASARGLRGVVFLGRVLGAGDDDYAIAR